MKAHPGSLVVLTAIEKADPQVLAQLEEAWQRGTIRNHLGEDISIAGTTFVLTTDLASDEIGQLARTESDPDRLYIECLKLLLDAGFSAAVLTYVDRAFCLRSNTAGELARDHHRHLQEWVAEYGLHLEAGALMPGSCMDPPNGPYATEDGVNWSDLDRKVSKAKTKRASVVRLVLGEDSILVVPAGKPVAPEPSTFPASAEEGSSPETAGAKP
ncbi:hypothetical protein ACFOYU_16760 [Microvirga sp. GCM10011540]|uniref:hypothetical protein n=1 Tax=Microvirga sp. GCM10011540 TaxID=3317338 RepID=UPI003618E0FB